MKQVIVFQFFVALALSDQDKRLLLHSDQDVGLALHELRLEINATKQENLALKAQMAQEIQLVKDQMARENLALKAQLARVERGQGSTYIRWGRTVCDGNGTQKVYSGYAGGTYYNHVGGGSSYICLPETPTWAQYHSGTQAERGEIYGAEYQTYEFNPFPKPMMNNDVPCVVCHAPRPVSLMIPASTTCFPGWTMEYTGYLMSGSNEHSSSTDYACVDKDPEAELHSEADQNGKLFYFTEAVCGSLPCQEYPTGRELACVVCSK